MKVRFLRTLASSNPEYPFQPGQIIVVPKLTLEMKGWLRDGAIQILPEPDEAAVVAAPERAVVPPAKGRRA